MNEELYFQHTLNPSIFAHHWFSRSKGARKLIVRENFLFSRIKVREN